MSASPVSITWHVHPSKFLNLKGAHPCLTDPGTEHVCTISHDRGPRAGEKTASRVRKVLIQSILQSKVEMGRNKWKITRDEGRCNHDGCGGSVQERIVTPDKQDRKHRDCSKS